MGTSSGFRVAPRKCRAAGARAVVLEQNFLQYNNKIALYSFTVGVRGVTTDFTSSPASSLAGARDRPERIGRQSGGCMR